jgi:hypothetical protein
MKFHVVFFTDMSARMWHARPLGAYRLATELRNQGYSVLVIDFLSQWLLDLKEFDRLLKSVISDQTLFVGYSGTFFSRGAEVFEFINNVDDYYKYKSECLSPWPVDSNTIRLINRRIKILNSNLSIFYGGAWASTSLDTLKPELCGVDYVVQGFADAYIVDIVKKLETKTHIPFSLENNCRVIKYDVTGAQFDFVNRSQTCYHESDCFAPGEILPLETSRGCMFKCKFCSFPLLGRKKNDPSYHKHVDVLAREIANNYEKFGITKYMFVDDTFNESTAKLQDVQQAIKNSGVDVKFFCYIRLDLIERFPEQIELLNDMGMQSAFLGIETLNSKSARAVGKNSDPESVKRTIESMRAVMGDRCNLHASFIAGLPHETEETVDQWMTWVHERHDLIDTFNIQPLNLNKTDTNWPSEITRDPEKYGYVTEPGTSFWTNNMGMTSKDSARICRKWLTKTWQSGRLKIGGFDIVGMQNLGYSFEQLQSQTLNSLPVADIKQRYQQRFKDYQQRLYTYIGK